MRRTVDNRPQRSLGDSRVRIALNACQHDRIEIKDLEYLRHTGARHAQAAREFSPGFTALLHGAPPFARDAHRIRTAALPWRDQARRFGWLIPGETVATLTVDSLPTAIKVKGNIEFEAVRIITQVGEPPSSPIQPDSPVTVPVTITSYSGLTVTSFTNAQTIPPLLVCEQCARPPGVWPTRTPARWGRSSWVASGNAA